MNKDIEIQEQAIAGSVSKPIVNRFCFLVAPSTIGMVFFETIDTPYARAAVCMSIETVEVFYEMLGKTLLDMNASKRKH